MYVLYRIAQSLDPTAESRAEVDKKSKETLIRMKVRCCHVLQRG